MAKPEEKQLQEKVYFVFFFFGQLETFIKNKLERCSWPQAQRKETRLS